ncbi:unnamed protein product [Dibothriocephalus latus]|uniref:Uncharacterized protein n=1 Tax=Dibothriocephalus latus TaxID=60516 RepID=A0A3P7LRP7_DIBLA|nr:unnamed protein product [Dibothriocephalus latus]
MAPEPEKLAEDWSSSRVPVVRPLMTNQSPLLMWIQKRLTALEGPIPVVEKEERPALSNSEDPSRVRSTSECRVPEGDLAPFKEPPMRELKKKPTRSVNVRRGKKPPPTVSNVVISTEPLTFIDSLYPLGAEPPYAVGRRRHPSAERYVTKFKQTRVELANRLFAFYNKVVFDETVIPFDF